MFSRPRRQFLATIAALAVPAVSGADAAGRRSPRAPHRRFIDVHHHILPPVYMAAARERIIAQGQGYLPAPVLEWTPEKSLAEMDENGVATAIVSVSTPGVWFGKATAARVLARKCNEYAAALARDYRGRFGFFAALPLPDMEGSLRELAYALDVLKADGVGLMTSYGGKWPGDAVFAPLLEELNRRKALVYVHPTGPSCCRELIPDVPYVMTELPHDTTRAVTSLLFSGALTRFADIRFTFSHAGGTLPMVAARIARQSRAIEKLSERLPKGVESELRRHYYEIAGSANRPAMSALMSLVPISQVLFGSDYPWGGTRANIAGLFELGLSREALHAIERANAAALFPRFA